MKANRRSFLALLGGVAASPTASAKAAAQAMGLSGALGGAAAAINEPRVIGHAGGPYSSQSTLDHISQLMNEMMSERGKMERRLNAAEVARRLDPDLASMRSMSPSAAYAIQRKRSEAAILDLERKRLRWWAIDVEKDGG